MRNEEGRWETGVKGLEGEWRSGEDFIFYLLHVSAHITLGLLFELWQPEKQILQYYGEVLHAFMATLFHECYRGEE